MIKLKLASFCLLLCPFGNLAYATVTIGNFGDVQKHGTTHLGFFSLLQNNKISKNTSAQLPFYGNTTYFPSASFIPCQPVLKVFNEGNIFLNLSTQISGNQIFSKRDEFYYRPPATRTDVFYITEDLDTFVVKKAFFALLVAMASSSFGQVPNYNSFPAITPTHILDDKLEDISFVLSMRVLISDYEGPLVRLRRENDDAEMDFGWSDNDIVDVDAITTWKGTANVYLVIWYDQSGLGRNAEQPTISRQPAFIPDASLPYFFGDGTSQYIDVNTSIQTLTDAGADGSVLGIFWATQRTQISFGNANGSNRWSSHLNWNNGATFFDPGICCNAIRSYGNTESIAVWKQYSFLRTAATIASRLNGVEKLSGAYTLGPTTSTGNFGILHAFGSTTELATIRINEMIMYKKGIASDWYTAIESNEIAFWKL